MKPSIYIQTMNKIAPLILSIIMLPGHSKAQDYTLESPGKVNRVEVFIGENITYQVIHNNKTVLYPSAISMTINGQTYGTSPKVREGPGQVRE